MLIDQAVAVIRDLQETWDPKSREGVIQDMAQLMEDKDWYTGRPHSQAVSSLSIRLGKALNGSAGWSLDLSHLGTIGYLHDIGKLTIPWSLLNKIAPISRRERVILEEHSGRGADLLVPAAEAVGVRRGQLLELLGGGLVPGVLLLQQLLEVAGDGHADGHLLAHPAHDPPELGQADD